MVHEKMERFAERIRLLFGEAPMTPEEQVYLAVALGGLRNAAAWFPAFSDADLNQYLMSAAERMP
ncbi:hypothetical protein [Archangium primigenium]|uniref:hypothetical protein n=1 Tax=[Archangium] primigenium TaxID=2792470 RepID=UPI001959C3E7|nr:hypothetical protein [Archangium primigenium]MBM7114436.1 hypothetical protein [Archangium primigenium]